MMGAPLTLNGRLPGVVCTAALPPSQESPLRLDVAAFVGFAERGPCDQPIAVEDISQYHAVFGGDLLLARTRQGGQPVFANLPEAVRAFFNNGGRRCYVVRVAGKDGRANRFRLPGIAAWDQHGLTLKSVIAPAAWIGRWSDNMSIGTQLRSLPLHLAQKPLDGTSLELHLELPAKTTVLPDDLLRLQFGGTGKPILFCSVDSLIQMGNAATTTRGVPVILKVKPDRVFAFTRNIDDPLPKPLSVERQKGQNYELLPASILSLEELPKLEDGYLLHVTTSAQIVKDDVLCVSCTGVAVDDVLFFPVTSVEEQPVDSPPAGSPPGEISLRLISRAPRWQFTPSLVECLEADGWKPISSQPLPSLEAQLGRGKAFTLHLPATAMTESVQVGDLLRITCTNGRVLLFPVTDLGLQQTPSNASPPEMANLHVISQTALWQLPLPSPTSPPIEDIYGELLQIDLLSFDLYIREGSQIQEIWQELRFGPGPNYWVDKLVSQAAVPSLDASRSISSQQGIPGLDASRSSRLGVPFAVSDIAGTQPPIYLPLGMGDLPAPEAFARPLPDTSVNSNPLCPLASKDGLESFNPKEMFLDSNLADVGARDLLNEANQLLYLNPGAPLQKLHSLLFIEEVGLISIPDLVNRGWVCLGPEEEKRPEQTSLHSTPDWSHFQNCFPRSTVREQVKRSACGEPLALSSPPEEMEVLDLRQQLNGLPVLESPEAYQMDGLLDVQRALVNLCAARADAFTVLSLPYHFKRGDVLEWQRRFATEASGFLTDSALSYAAVYHPWLQAREEATPELAPLRATPPDGAVCGMIAARELVRGPWIAPANVPLLGVVSLSPALTADDWSELFNSQVNVVRQRPGQFTLLSAHTLSSDRQFLQISVRRLLIFLRKLALYRGMRYVFETNNERFRQRVQASFEHTLTVLAARGALNAFEVVIGAEINTPNDFDNGRFLIALKVAPTIPIEFITVVLLRAGEGLLEIVER